MKAKIEEKERNFKIVVVGNSGVGKTNLVSRYADDEFDENYRTTIGLDFKFKETVIGGVHAKVQIWDTAGQEKLKAIAASYYKNAEGVVIVYDITNRESFQKLDFWINESKNNVSPDVPFIMIGNKNDLLQAREVSMEEAKLFAEKHNLFYTEASAKTNENDNVTKAFEQLIGDMLRKHMEQEEIISKQIKRESKLKLTSGNNSQQSDSKKGCC